MECPPGTAAGSIEQNISCFVPSFDINDASENTIYRLDGIEIIFEENNCEYYALKLNKINL